MELKKGKKRSLRATLKELYIRATPFLDSKDKEKIYFNGEDNLYPNEIERVINGSPTATRARTVMRKFISGKGLLAGEDVVINDFNGKKLSGLIKDIAEEVSYHYGAFIHVTFGSNLKPKFLEVLNYSKCRIGKEDNDGYNGMVFYKDWECGRKTTTGKEEDALCYYPFNPRENVIKSQIAKDNKITVEELNIEEHLENHRGQVFYLNLTPRYKYALSPVDSAYNDADSEYRFGLYTNGQLRTGFMGKTIVVTQGLDEEDVEKVSEDLKSFMGSEGSQDLFHMDVEQTADIEKVIYVNQLKAQFDDKLFDLTDKRIKKNLLGAFNNIPLGLVDSSDGSLFGTNEGTYQLMQEFYNDQTEEEREEITTALALLGFPCKIKPLIEKKIKENETT